MYTDSETYDDQELTDKDKEIPVKMGPGEMVETFPELSIDLADDIKNNVVFRKCGDLKSEASKPLSRECDDIIGSSMRDCVGPASKDCGVSFLVWSKLQLASFYGLLKGNAVMDDFKPAHIFFDQTKLTLAGLDNRDGQDAKKAATIAGIGKVVTEMLMRKEITKTDLDKQKVSEQKELKLDNIEAY